MMNLGVDMYSKLEEDILERIQFKRSEPARGIINSHYDVDQIFKHGSSMQKISALRSKHVTDAHIHRGLNDPDQRVQQVAETLSRIKMNHALSLRHPKLNEDVNDSIIRRKILPPKDERNLRKFMKDSSAINVAHWDAKLSGKKLEDDNSINDILDKLPRNKKETHVYNGMCDHNIPEHILANGGIVHIPAYMSSSMSQDVASKFASLGRKSKGALLEIKLHKNNDAGGYVAHYSDRPDDQEFLFKRNTLLKLEEPRTEGKYKIYPTHVMTDEEIQEHKKHPEVKSYLKMKKGLE